MSMVRVVAGRTTADGMVEFESQLGKEPALKWKLEDLEEAGERVSG